MGENNRKKITKDNVVVKFVGDSGDGMQLVGTIFSETIALSGKDISTFPDYPAEIRAPRNTVAGVSGFQVHFGSKKILTPGDQCDVLVAFNPASMKSNLANVKIGGTIITDSDSYDEKVLEKLGYTSNPLFDDSLKSYNVVHAPITSLAKESLSSMNVDTKTAERTKNMFVLGMIFNMFDLDLKATDDYLNKRFKKKPELIKINEVVINAGYNFAETIEAIPSFVVPPTKLKKGKYRSIQGNEATAWGLMAAAEKSGLQLFLGSYPITPATDILIELAKHRELGVKTFQAEDEIAGICSAIGASFAGSLACTTTSGPGFSLKSEAMGLAVMTELPLVVVNVQRGGPSTGLPTKSEQADLLQALYGRNGEAPMIVFAASSPADCFYTAYEAAKYSLEHMTPAVCLTDGFIANGTEIMEVPKMSEMATIKPRKAAPRKDTDPRFNPYRRDEKTLAREWAIPGTEGLRHRIGGLEKTDIYGAVSTDPINHEKMVKNRAEKVKRVADYLPLQEFSGQKNADLLVVSWGGTKGQVEGAVCDANELGMNIAHAHFRYINPLPKNTKELLSSFKKILVCELNSGQFAAYLRMNFPEIEYLQYNKVQGRPFTEAELIENFKKILNV
ncbi:MAG: 2-oxoacid:acceptor oxidoreductase subunit alpha [Bacteroidales bacterium]|nr:2-oxoacid:acceptor oxidoreductase subunit alpha [Bacteroidales bacterium]